MKYRTRQEIFDLAYKGLASQWFKQSNAAFGCAYRGDYGLKCAVGWCIPDEEYYYELEKYAVDSNAVLSAANIDKCDSGFARDLQRVHDIASSKLDMRLRLQEFAKVYKLTVPEVGK